MRPRVDRWWPGCLLIALGVLLYTAHAIVVPHGAAAPAGTASATTAAPAVTCVDRGLPASEPGCGAYTAGHQVARQTSAKTAAAQPHRPAGEARPVTAEPPEPGREAERSVDRALLQVWRH
ncbi:hypothetical protein [Phytohabitans kaempferiae]|uniref:Secreted protein n=1 Tax=Phytohabitans kaempferiae TaxID=1620943 RepID=A0ABV6M1Q1_9ACTN